MKQKTIYSYLRRLGLLVLAIGLLSAIPAKGWFDDGHRLITQSALKLVQKKVPAFLTEGSETVIHCCVDPDFFAGSTLAQLRAEEGPEHYCDMKLMREVSFPSDRYKFIEAFVKKGRHPKEAGLLPYQLIEATQRLTLIFAEYRKWPANKSIQLKCLVYAGVLAHYAGDAGQPLHTTVDFDGRQKADGTSSHTGIHKKTDALLGKLNQAAPLNGREIIVAAITDLPAGVFEFLKQSHALVDRVYQLEKELPPLKGSWTPTPAITAFGEERFRASVSFTANLYLTAWEQSATVEIPSWLKEK